MKSDKINILITGGGSVMGQSLFRALNHSSFAEKINIYYTNSEPVCAAFAFNSTGFYKIPVIETFIVPVAKDKNFIPAIKKICTDKNIDLVFGGTEHEIYALAELKKENGFENIVTGLDLKFVDITTDKYKLGCFFEKHNIEAPATDLYVNKKAFADKYGFPIIVKPRKSSASRNILKINKAEAFPVQPFDNENNIILQEYIGSSAREYTVGCYLDSISQKDSYIIMERTLTVDGATGFGKVINDSKIYEYCKKIMRAFVDEGFKGGAFNIQLRLRNGISPEAFEINGRYSSSEGPRAKLGFNALEATIENMIYHKSYDRFNPKIGSSFLRYYEEVFWL